MAAGKVLCSAGNDRVVWQVNGRSDKPMHLNTEDDLYYIQHYSIWLDIQILFKTIWVVLRGKGAY